MSCEKCLLSLQDGRPAPGADTVRHLIDCADCREAWTTVALLEGASPELPDASTCVEPAQRFDPLAAAPDEDPGLPEHLVDCRYCFERCLEWLRELDSVREIELAQPPPALENRAIEEGPRFPGVSSPGWWRWGLRLSAAAAAILIAVGGSKIWIERERAVRAPRDASTYRAVEPADSAPVIVAPLGELEAMAGLRFEWRGNAESYRLLVIDVETGETVLDAVTGETVFTPTEAQLGRLRRSVRYRWLVEPRRPRGAPSESGAFWFTPGS